MACPRSFVALAVRDDDTSSPATPDGVTHIGWLRPGDAVRFCRASDDEVVVTLTHLQRREAQAPLMRRVLDGFAEHFGQEAVNAVLEELIEEDARESARELSELYGGNTMRELAQIVREVWAEDGAMEMEFLEETPDRLSFNVTRCKYAEAYQRNGMIELGRCLSCDRDGPFTSSFNENLELRRTQTIMEGADYCDFRFVRRSSS